jgi:outer membrane protein assembly factor BamD (BamD/ComL family)
LVFNAMRLLRREGQPTQAAALLDEYLSRHPSGAMAEEALALSIEAAAARGDGRAKDLIRQYVARYPNGHFRGVVEAARTRLSP